MSGPLTNEQIQTAFAVHRQPDFLVIQTPDAKLTLNRPKSWLARRIWRWFGFDWH